MRGASWVEALLGHHACKVGAGDGGRKAGRSSARGSTSGAAQAKSKAAACPEPPLPATFDQLTVGQVASLGVGALNQRAIDAFCEAFAPAWDRDGGAPDAMVYALWSKLDGEAARGWPQTKRLGVDALRWMRNPPAGELLRGRMTVLALDPVGDDKGVVIAQHDLLDEAGRLVFSCLTRSVFRR